MSDAVPRTEVDTEKRPATATGPPSPKKQKLDAADSKPIEVTANASSVLPALQIKKLSPSARTPTRGSEFAAGYDMYAYVAPPQSRARSTAERET